MNTPVFGFPLWQVVVALLVIYYVYTTYMQTPQVVSESRPATTRPVTVSPVVTTKPAQVAKFANVDSKVPKSIIYNFNTSWCGYSVDFQPTWDAFSKELNSSRPSSEVVAVDMKCDDGANRDLCMKWEIRGFPTVIKVVTDGTVDKNGHPNGRKMELDGPRNMDSLRALAK